MTMEFKGGGDKGVPGVVGKAGHGTAVTVRARVLAVIMGATFGSGLMAIRLREPSVIRPGSAYYAKRRDDRRDFLARLQYQLGREAVGVAERAGQGVAA